MTRITIKGQGYGTGDNGGSVTIDRSVPGDLRRAMSGHEWTSFYDKVDEALAPAGLLRQKVIGAQKCFMLIIIIVMIVLFVFTPILSYFEVSSVITLLILIVGGVLFFVIFCGSSMRTRSAVKKLQEIKKKVEQVCEEESRKRSNVSFHFRVSERCCEEFEFSFSYYGINQSLSSSI